MYKLEPNEVVELCNPGEFGFAGFGVDQNYYLEFVWGPDLNN